MLVTSAQDHVGKVAVDFELGQFVSADQAAASQRQVENGQRVFKNQMLAYDTEDVASRSDAESCGTDFAFGVAVPHVGSPLPVWVGLQSVPTRRKGHADPKIDLAPPWKRGDLRLVLTTVYEQNVDDAWVLRQTELVDSLQDRLDCA